MEVPVGKGVSLRRVQRGNIPYPYLEVPSTYLCTAVITIISIIIINPEKSRRCCLQSQRGLTYGVPYTRHTRAIR